MRCFSLLSLFLLVGCVYGPPKKGWRAPPEQGTGWRTQQLPEQGTPFKKTYDNAATARNPKDLEQNYVVGMVGLFHILGNTTVRPPGTICATCTDHKDIADGVVRIFVPLNREIDWSKRSTLQQQLGQCAFACIPQKNKTDMHRQSVHIVALITSLFDNPKQTVEHLKSNAAKLRLAGISTTITKPEDIGITETDTGSKDYLRYLNAAQENWSQLEFQRNQCQHLLTIFLQVTDMESQFRKIAHDAGLQAAYDKRQKRLATAQAAKTQAEARHAQAAAQTKSKQDPQVQQLTRTICEIQAQQNALEQAHKAHKMQILQGPGKSKQSQKRGDDTTERRIATRDETYERKRAELTGQLTELKGSLRQRLDQLRATAMTQTSPAAEHPTASSSGLEDTEHDPSLATNTTSSTKHRI